MQHITIKPMTVIGEDLEAKRRVELIAARLIAVLVTLWFVAALYAALASTDRMLELAARV